MNKGIWLLFLIGIVSLMRELVMRCDHVFLAYSAAAYAVVIGIGYAVKMKR